MMTSLCSYEIVALSVISFLLGFSSIEIILRITFTTIISGQVVLWETHGGVTLIRYQLCVYTTNCSRHVVLNS